MRMRVAAILAMVAIAVVPACSTSKTGTPAPPSSTPSSTAAGTTSGAAPASDCSYQADPNEPAPAGKDVGLPTGTEPAAGTITLRTNQGEIRIALKAAAPCTARSFVHLAEKQYFNDSPCHRLTTGEGLKVLQCGDPTGSGRGGPGYTIPDENPTDLKPGKPAPDGSPTVIYERGVVAMANTGAPHSGGSQFFIVYGDSTLQPSYAVFGTVDAAGLAVLDKIATGGVEPDLGPNDGAPKLGVTIQQTVRGS
jgi:peptidyl-prolyl cis-trans isomerase B (cyclophilin B)